MPLSPAPVTPSPTDQLKDLGLPEHTMSPGPQPPSAWKTLPQSLCSGTPVCYLLLGLGLILPGDGPPRPTWVTPALQAGARLVPLGSPSRAQPEAWHTVGAQLIGVSQALLRPVTRCSLCPLRLLSHRNVRVKPRSCGKCLRPEPSPYIPLWPLAPLLPNQERGRWLHEPIWGAMGVPRG